LGAYKIKNLATSNCGKDWDKVAPPGRAREGKPSGRVRAEDAKLVR